MIVDNDVLNRLNRNYLLVKEAWGKDFFQREMSLFIDMLNLNIVENNSNKVHLLSG